MLSTDILKVITLHVYQHIPLLFISRFSGKSIYTGNNNSQAHISSPNLLLLYLVSLVSNIFPPPPYPTPPPPPHYSTHPLSPFDMGTSAFSNYHIWLSNLNLPDNNTCMGTFFAKRYSLAVSPEFKIPSAILTAWYGLWRKVL